MIPRHVILAALAAVALPVMAGSPDSVPNAPGVYVGSRPGKYVGDPVGLADGTVFDTVVDLCVSRPDIDLVFRRHYDSLFCDASALGDGWNHAYEGQVAVRNGETWVRFAGEADVSDSIRRFPSLAPGACAFDERGDELRRFADGSYELVTPDRRRYAYGSAGLLASVTTWNGTSVTLVRESPSGPVVRADHSDGGSLVFGYSQGCLVRVSTPDPGVFVELAYGECGGRKILERVVRHDGASASTNCYSYASIPPPGARKEFFKGIASFASVARAQLPAQPPITGGTGSGGIGYGGGAETPGRLGVLRPVLTEKTDSNGVSTRYRYVRPDDSQVVRCEHTEMDGGLFAAELDYSHGRTVVRRPVASGTAVTRLEFDGHYRETLRRTGDETSARAYDSRGCLVRFEASDSRTGGRVVRTATYDDRRRPVLATFALGDGTGDVVRCEWDDVRGMPRRLESPAGRVFEWTTNANEVIVFGAGADDPRLVMRVECSTNSRPLSVALQGGGSVRLAYGEDGLVSRIEADGLPSADIGRDAFGNVSSVSLPDPHGGDRVTRFARNWRGRPLSVAHPDGTSESFVYDGNGTRMTRHVDAFGREDVYRWTLGLPVHAGRVVNGVTNALFSVSHDQQLNVVAIADPLGRSAESYVLDENERVVAVTNLEGQVLSRSYLVGGFVASETRFDGTEVTYGYDGGGRLASAAYSDETLRFAYDPDGLLVAAEGSAGTVSNDYDAATGWLDRSVGADGTEVRLFRSDGGGVTAVVSVAGTTVHALDAAMRRVRTLSPAGSASFGYCRWNGFVESAAVGGVTAEYAYDVMDRVTNIVWKTASGARLGGFGYEYDAVGRIVSRTHDLGTNRFDRVYAYDDLDRLASDGDVRYAYDAAGNRTSRTDGGEAVAYTLGRGDRLASWTGGSYGYDAAGCVTRIVRGADTWDLEWNGRCQLVSVATNGVFAESYSYDALGRRVTTRNAEGTERHVYDENWQVIADLDENGEVVRSYVWGEGIDRLLMVKIGGRVYTALADIQGTVWGYADENGNVVARWVYDAWGNVLAEEVDASAEELRAVRYRFQGREWSAATGLVNFRMRWYDAVTGRWLSKDPIRLGGGLNLYEFCGGDPINYVDLIGLCSDEKQKIKDLRNWLFGGSLMMEILWGVEMHGAGEEMDYAATQPKRVWSFPDLKTRRPNEMGNYMAGYAAGYSNHPLFLYFGVRAGGMLFGAMGSREGRMDSGSVPDINAGFIDGVIEHEVDRVADEIGSAIDIMDMFLRWL